MKYTVYAKGIGGYTITNQNVTANSPEEAIEIVKDHMSRQSIFWSEAEFTAVQTDE